MNVFKMKCVRNLAGVTKRDKIKNKLIRRKTGVEMDVADRSVMSWFGLLKKLDANSLTNRV